VSAHDGEQSRCTLEDLREDGLVTSTVILQGSELERDREYSIIACYLIYFEGRIFYYYGSTETVSIMEILFRIADNIITARGFAEGASSLQLHCLFLVTQLIETKCMNANEPDALGLNPTLPVSTDSLLPARPNSIPQNSRHRWLDGTLRLNGCNFWDRRSNIRKNPRQYHIPRLSLAGAWKKMRAHCLCLGKPVVFWARTYIEIS
jgi:hypothetical protein